MNYQYPYNNSYGNRKRNEGVYLNKLARQLAIILIILLFLLLCKYVRNGATAAINSKIKTVINLDYTSKAKAAFANGGFNLDGYFKGFLNKFNMNKEFKIEYLPVEGKVVTAFGRVIDPKTKKEKDNKGIDISVKEGTGVKAVYDGTVETVENDKAIGLMIVIDHNNGFKTSYSNLSQSNVNEGETIAKGSVIALSGKGGTANTTGGGIHFEVIKDKANVNPMDYLNK